LYLPHLCDPETIIAQGMFWLFFDRNNAVKKTQDVITPRKFDMEPENGTLEIGDSFWTPSSFTFHVKLGVV